jgi:hypothetical protein
MKVEAPFRSVATGPTEVLSPPRRVEKVGTAAELHSAEGGILEAHLDLLASLASLQDRG